MSKNKYKPEGTVTAEGGERKQRDHTKTGKLLQRHETRRLEAIARQTRRIMEVEKAMKGGKVDPKITAYISTFKNPGHALQHAQFTLQKVRGGVPHSQLVLKTDAPAAPVPAVAEAVAKPAEEKPKNKYRRKKAAAQKNAAGGTTPAA